MGFDAAVNGPMIVTGGTNDKIPLSNVNVPRLVGVGIGAKGHCTVRLFESDGSTLVVEKKFSTADFVNNSVPIFAKLIHTTGTLAEPVYNSETDIVTYVSDGYADVVAIKAEVELSGKWDLIHVELWDIGSPTAMTVNGSGRVLAYFS